MKPDGGTMETNEPTEAAAVAEPSTSQDNVTEQAPSQPDEAANGAAPRAAAAKANGKPVAADPKVKPKALATKTQPAAKSAWASGSRPGTASPRTANGVKSSNHTAAAAVKKTATTAKASAAGAVPKRPMGGAAVSSTVKNQSRVPDKKPVGPARTTSAAAATATNSSKPTSVNAMPKKRPVAETVNVARPKTTAAASSTAPKPSTSTTTKAGVAGVSKTTRPATSTSTSRPAFTTARPTTSTVKPSNTATAKTAASRVTTAPSTGRTTAAPPPKTVAAKKDVSRPPSAAAKKPTAATASAATKKPEPSKPTATVKLNSASKWSTAEKTADPKMPQSKASQPARSTPLKKPVPTVWSNAHNKQPLGRVPPASPVNKPANGICQAKRGPKPSLAVPPFTAAKKTGVSNTTKSAVEAQRAAAATAATVLAATQAEATESLPQGSSLAASAPEDDRPQVLARDTTPEVVPQETAQRHSAASSPLQSPVRTALPQTFPPQEQPRSDAPSLTTQEQTPATAEQTPAPAEPALPSEACSSELFEEAVYLLTNQTPSPSKALPAAAAAAAAAANAIPLVVPLTNLNEEEDEEEREGSQLVSVSEMSGTTQPTEESRPGSAGPVGGSAWRAGGALLSELDSEEVSGSQQGASELSAPGVLEGTESMDDLGDGSLKGAIDMEGASAGSPDFEKVPDIPVNDFDEDEDEYDDRVCDMDVGSERADEPQRPRHDNDVDEEEEEEEEDEEDDDEDVEMASEGVTESGLESYGNADEDDFAEDERLDNLNRVAEPPPPPLLPSAPAAQWDQPNPFVDPWAEPLQPQQGLEPAQVAGAAAASPLVDLCQADSKTPTQAQAWLQLGSAPSVPENREEQEPRNVEAQMYMDQSCPALMQTMVPALFSAPGMSLSSTLSSETSTPKELCDYNQGGKLQPQDVRAPPLSTQPDLDQEAEEEEEEAEAETLPADEVLGGPATAPNSNPSSTSVTEDEASDTEGEALLDDSLEGPVVRHIIFDSQPLAQRCLSAVEEEATMEEAEGGGGDDSTPPSATSLASYGFDTMTTASNSNAQSTGESCIKSPGIFSLEELSEEAKEPCLIPQPHTQPCLGEQQYIDCGKQEAESAERVGEEAAGPEEALEPTSTLRTLQQPEENPDDVQPPYYSAICEKTDNSFAGLTALPHPHRRDHSAYPRTYCDLLKPLAAAVTPPRLTCADLPPRSLGQQALSPQLRRLEQHQRQLLEMQQRRDQQSRPLEEAEQERKRREEEEQRRKKEEAEEEIKRNEEALERKMREQAAAMTKKKEEEERLKKEDDRKQRRDLELQLQQQQQELKERQQIMQWQQELQQSNKGQAVPLSPSSGLCTIYEALETSDEEEAEGAEEGINELNAAKGKKEPRKETTDDREGVPSDKDKHRDSPPSTESPPPPLPDSPQTSSNPSQDGDSSSPCPPESPERPPPLDLDWGKKVDIVQQLINQTLLLNRDGCSSLLLLPGGAGGTLSPLESSLWPSLLPPLTPPSATVTSVSSFSPEATGSAPQGEWTVVELETHH